ncbi:hypothetical protein A2276_04735 [candidate division WOR-1 bacterium RIFOXYA12_FULL_43_27]|uniref:Prepilin-type N-terminal cleavage/methylation domain-containing protein n=1 Tax=candidate division WOR-1 bacterium RIFOXYC2_FULL_46_14 TaxID=1802587 RepID=A0A1F4U313_UNCSA|nr:MAG: hypothetical protein A2276_04735 [candidate division WOR-1 bacterium RIFOXYA12_FULL_43_27]OGC18869.1 MAG: hypothetical protein A2292_08100 [candidate division WOR-1 bacterium RIFOXYB2_FULL_46_45]OGC29010.1 MAG: hypothetical protein A2232_03165 [candidate division WOR-1 bacterium RIFOXYA2_FULL_46_56]OGC39269.1 MAG: hypothetical protein A2438_07065 [candidate division WOR-1 bacterium RIFOXYC2_FULL_46_14]
MKKAGFTLIEIIMAIVITGIIVISVASAYRQIVFSIGQNAKISKALDLSRLEFSIVNSIGYTDATLAGGYNNLTSNYQSSGFDLRRMVTYEAGDALSAQSLKHITVTVLSGSQTILSTDILRAKNVTYAP